MQTGLFSLVRRNQNLRPLGRFGAILQSSEEDPLEGLPEPPVAFCTALMLPGVMTYSLCLFFSKLINYTFLFWLPFYISNIGEYVPLNGFVWHPRLSP